VLWRQRIKELPAGALRLRRTRPGCVRHIYVGPGVLDERVRARGVDLGLASIELTRGCVVRSGVATDCGRRWRSLASVINIVVIVFVVPAGAAGDEQDQTEEQRNPNRRDCPNHGSDPRPRVYAARRA
jgi:hypothetical protein